MKEGVTLLEVKDIVRSAYWIVFDSLSSGTTCDSLVQREAVSLKK